ncbi:hypothetical protein EJ03DRAFT_339494 [Teratosphaeria nubilosa]|uniref:Uncharacterized protein n=1 Tax=Teratosphaeria nubilosa TaxID=161662 RepID=A0A6G1KW86_9PEZI|nr:hypothetical protein EJ03DRAFT_339494 [Teratosphaeria nubilosa]
MSRRPPSLPEPSHGSPTTAALPPPFIVSTASSTTTAALNEVEQRTNKQIDHEAGTIFYCRPAALIASDYVFPRSAWITIPRQSCCGDMASCLQQSEARLSSKHPSCFVSVMTTGVQKPTASCSKSHYWSMSTMGLCSDSSDSKSGGEDREECRGPSTSGHLLDVSYR